VLINLDTTEELITQSPTEPIFDGIKVVTSSLDQSLQRPIECAIKELGGLDILINNVLPLPDIAPVEQQTTEAFKAAFNRIECAAMAMAASIWPVRFWISADSVDVRDQSPEQRHPLPP